MFLHRLAPYFCAARFWITALAMVWLFASSAFAEEKPMTVTAMDQQDKQFQARVLVVNTGTQVSFPNSDNIRHHVYSFSEPKHFEIKLYADAPNEPVTQTKTSRFR